MHEWMTTSLSLSLSHVCVASPGDYVALITSSFFFFFFCLTNSLPLPLNKGLSHCWGSLLHDRTGPCTSVDWASEPGFNDRAHQKAAQLEVNSPSSKYIPLPSSSLINDRFVSNVRLAMSPSHTLQSNIKRVAICAGAGASVVKKARADLFLTGTYTYIWQHAHTEREKREREREAERSHHVHMYVCVWLQERWAIMKCWMLCLVAFLWCCANTQTQRGHTFPPWSASSKKSWRAIRLQSPSPPPTLIPFSSYEVKSREIDTRYLQTMVVFFYTAVFRSCTRIKQARDENSTHTHTRLEMIESTEGWCDAKWSGPNIYVIMEVTFRLWVTLDDTFFLEGGHQLLHGLHHLSSLSLGGLCHLQHL